MMKAQTKRTLYRVFLLVCGLAVVVGTVLIACNAIEPARAGATGYYWAFGIAIAFLVLLPVNTIVHEAGHLVFGYLAGMKFSSIRFARFRLLRVGKKVRGRFLRGKEVAGSCEMYPGSAKNVRGRMIFYALGGAVFNLVYGAAFVVTCFLCPMHPVLYFFQLFAPLCLLDAATSLYPAETATGKTDGEMIRGLAAREPSSVVALHVLTVQGMLNTGSFSDIDEKFLFDLPVVREDDPAFLAITQLRWEYLFSKGDEAGALKQLFRLESLYDYLPEINRSDVACELLYAYSVLAPDLLKAECYLTDAAEANGTCAYYRAMAAYTLAKGEPHDHFLDEAKRILPQEPIRGISELEQKFIGKLDGKCAESVSAGQAD